MIALEEHPEKMDAYKLLANYLQTIIRKSEFGKPVLQPWWILEDTAQVWPLIENLASRIDTDGLTGVCALADSGIPIGVPLAQALEMPCYVYRRKMWSLDDIPGPQHVVPRLSSESTITLVDSHIATGFTVSACLNYFSEQNISVKHVVAPLSIVPKRYLPFRETGIEYVILQDYVAKDAVADLLFGIKGVQRANLEQDFPSLIRSYAEEIDDTGYLLSKKERLKLIAKSYITRSSIPILNPYNEDLAKDLRLAFDSRDSKVWEFFSKPDLVKRACLSVPEVINLDKIDIIVGTGEIGTIFALCVAYHCKFTGMILTTLERGLEWYYQENNSKRKRVLVCSGRLKTGQYLLGAKKRMSRLGLEIDSILALRYTPEEVRRPRNRLVTAVKELESQIFIMS